MRRRATESTAVRQDLFLLSAVEHSRVKSDISCTKEGTGISAAGITSGLNSARLLSSRLTLLSRRAGVRLSLPGPRPCATIQRYND